MWIKKRHYRVKTLLVKIFRKTLKKKNIEFETYDLKGPCVILCNHQTSLDQFILSAVVNDPLYLMATEDLFSNGFISRVLEYLVAPISKTKSLPDLSSVKKCMNIIKENGMIGIFPEGNRTYNGHLCQIDDGIAKLIKKLNCDVHVFNISGGYAFEPRWSNYQTKSKVTCKKVKTLTKEELKDLDVNDLYTMLINYLDPKDFNNEYKVNNVTAESMERLFYYCPKCHCISSICSKDNHVFCTKCDFDAIYTPSLKFKTNFEPLNNKSVYDWNLIQDNFMNAKSIDELNDLLFNDKSIKLYKVNLNVNKKLIGKGEVSMNGSLLTFNFKKNKIEIDNNDIIGMTCLGRKKLGIYLKDKLIYQIKGKDNFNPVKYMNMFYRYKNIKGGNENDRFLGI